MNPVGSSNAERRVPSSSSVRYRPGCSYSAIARARVLLPDCLGAQKTNGPRFAQRLDNGPPDIAIDQGRADIRRQNIAVSDNWGVTSRTIGEFTVGQLGNKHEPNMELSARRCPLTPPGEEQREIGPVTLPWPRDQLTSDDVERRLELPMVDTHDDCASRVHTSSLCPAAHDQRKIHDVERDEDPFFARCDSRL